MRKADKTKRPKGINAGETLILMEFLGIFYNSERRENKMLEANPNLESWMTSCHGREKMLTLCCNLYNEKKRASCSKYSR